MTPAFRILVVDDDPVMRELLEALLEFAGHTVDIVSSGDLALERLRTTRFDAVLTDLHMPGLQGRELAERLLAERSDGTVLVGMSGSFPTEEETRLFDYFLQKPFTLDQFAAALEAARRQLGSNLHSEMDNEGKTLDESVFERLQESLPPDALRGLYKLTLDDVLERLERMKAAAVKQDFDTVRREAHSIKGGSGMVGAAELYYAATELETDVTRPATAFAKIATACERLRGMLDKRLCPADPS